MSFAQFQSSLASPRLQAIAAHWNAVRGCAAMPSWEQLQPSKIAPYLAMIWVWKYDRASGEFTGRLAGSLITRAFDQNFRGIPMDEAFPASVLAWVKPGMVRLLDESLLYRNSGNLFRQGGHITQGERIMLPLAGDGAHGDGVLGASCYGPLLTTRRDDMEILRDREEWFAVDMPQDRRLRA